MFYIVYKGNCYTTLNVLFSPKLNGSDFFKILELIEFPIKESENVLLKYAITELVTNSVRALHERNREKEVTVDFQVSGNFVKVVITDYAGGFDISVLPIDINEENQKIDILADEFQEYRERHSYNRFGIGLVSAKLAMDAFHLVFIDDDGRETPWQGDGSVSGTRITAAKRINPSSRNWEEGAVIRRNRRHSIFSKVVINDVIEAYLIDMSVEGVRLLCIERTKLEKGEKIGVRIGELEGLKNGMTFAMEIRWISQEGLFWQIGGEFIKDESFPVDNISTIVEKITYDPTLLPGLVVIRGS